MQTIVSFIHTLTWDDIPESAKHACRRSLIDLLGVAAAGTQTTLSAIIREFAKEQFGAGTKPVRLLFDDGLCSASGAALAGGMLIDSVDAHDGQKLTKGHVGCGVLPALLATTELQNNISEQEFLCALALGYEIGSRAGIALHQSVSDYHTSGAWVALSCAAVSSRLMKLSHEQTWEALGIAEYHGPRSQMMRCIDHPTMVKDGSGWGAMAGISAALLAKSGFTGAPAITMSAESISDVWADIGTRWYVEEQYIKLYPVCRWAQPAIKAALILRQEHTVDFKDIKSIVIGTFHEASRLATKYPTSSEQAQYSLPFPVAVALVHGEVGVQHIDGKGLNDERVLALSELVEFKQVSEYDAAFPAQRFSDVTLIMNDGRRLSSGSVEAEGDPENPIDNQILLAKFKQLAAPVLGEERAERIQQNVMKMGSSDSPQAFQQFLDLIHTHP